MLARSYPRTGQWTVEELTLQRPANDDETNDNLKEAIRAHVMNNTSVVKIEAMSSTVVGRRRQRKPFREEVRVKAIADSTVAPRAPAKSRPTMPIAHKQQQRQEATAANCEVWERLVEEFLVEGNFDEDQR